MWHLYVNGDVNSPYVFEDQGVLHQHLSMLPTNSIFMIRKFDVLLKSETVYGVTGSPPIPNAPNPAISIMTTQRTHYSRLQN